MNTRNERLRQLIAQHQREMADPKSIPIEELINTAVDSFSRPRLTDEIWGVRSVKSTSDIPATIEARLTYLRKVREQSIASGVDLADLTHVAVQAQSAPHVAEDTEPFPLQMSVLAADTREMIDRLGAQFRFASRGLARMFLSDIGMVLLGVVLVSTLVLLTENYANEAALGSFRAFWVMPLLLSLALAGLSWLAARHWKFALLTNSAGAFAGAVAVTLLGWGFYTQHQAMTTRSELVKSLLETSQNAAQVKASYRNYPDKIETLIGSETITVTARRDPVSMQTMQYSQVLPEWNASYLVRLPDLPEPTETRALNERDVLLKSILSSTAGDVKVRDHIVVGVLGGTLSHVDASTATLHFTRVSKTSTKARDEFQLMGCNGGFVESIEKLNTESPKSPVVVLAGFETAKGNAQQGMNVQVSAFATNHFLPQGRCATLLGGSVP